MKALILGADGQLGRAFQQTLPDARALRREEMDISDPNAVSDYDWGETEVVFNAAAYTNVDGAEAPEGRADAWKTNAAGVASLVGAAQRAGFTLVHFSTDYVFDGTKENHSEDEPLSPLGLYGASKAAGEVALALAPKHYLLRTSWVIGDGKNFVRTMLSLGQKGIAPTVVADQVGRPSFTDELARAALHLVEKNAEFGTYNASNGGDPVSWADFTRAIFAEASFDITVGETTTEKYFADKPEAARRPLRSDFNLAKLEATGFSPRDWRESLRGYVKQELA